MVAAAAPCAGTARASSQINNLLTNQSMRQLYRNTFGEGVEGFADPHGDCQSNTKWRISLVPFATRGCVENRDMTNP